MSKLFSPLSVLALLLALVVLGYCAEAAFGHDWYEPACCDERDCRPAKPGEVILERNGDFTITSTGERLDWNDDKVRYMAPDGRYHVCQFTTSDGDFGQSVPVIVTRCLYVPPGGV